MRSPDFWLAPGEVLTEAAARASDSLAELEWDATLAIVREGERRDREDRERRDREQRLERELAARRAAENGETWNGRLRAHAEVVHGEDLPDDVAMGLCRAALAKAETGRRE